MATDKRNLADPKQVEESDRRSKSQRQQEIEDVIRIMSTDNGRRFMTRMLDITGFQKSSFTGNSTTFFNEGMRNIGLMLWADIQEVPPELYLKMLQEQREKGKNG